MEKVAVINKNNEAHNTKINENRARNETLTTELLFENFKQYAWLSSAVIGFIALLLQLKTINLTSSVYIAIGFLAATILVSLFAKDYIVDSLLKGKTIYDIRTYISVFKFTAMFSLGISLGVLSKSFF